MLHHIFSQLMFVPSKNKINRIFGRNKKGAAYVRTDLVVLTDNELIIFTFRANGSQLMTVQRERFLVSVPQSRK